MRMFSTLLVGGSLLACLVAAVEDRELFASLNPPELHLSDLEGWRDAIRPSAAERAAESIPWLPSMVAGLERSEAKQKPLLLWLMNGHPLGCT